MDDRDSAPDGAPTKLTRTKEKWAREGKFLTGRDARPDSQRLPPGQHLVKDWPVLDLGVVPNINRETWRLDVVGAIEHPISWNWSEFLAEPQTIEVSDIHCVTTWSRYDNKWEGLATRDLLAQVMPHDDAAFVILTSYDGYTTNLPLADFAAEDALIAHSWEGKPLPPEHGGPARPHLYFWKSAKWLQKIEIATRDHPGFWEVRGYHNRGDPWAEQRYSE